MTSEDRKRDLVDLATEDDDEEGLADRLARHRTVLANERTLLSYVRTTLAIVVAGVSFIQFFGSWIIGLVGWIFIALAGLIMFAGVRRYRRIRSRLVTPGGGRETRARRPAQTSESGPPGPTS